MTGSATPTARTESTAFTAFTVFMALLRYQTALLLRSQRWLPPVLLYAAVFAGGVRFGEPLLDSLGYAAAALVPVSAWLVRVCVNGESRAARHCAAAPAGPATVQLSVLLAAFVSALVLGAVGTVGVLVVSDPHSTDGRVEVALLPAAGAGLLTVLVCALVGTAVGALCNWPVLRGTGWSVTSTVLVAVLALVTVGSPPNAALRGLITGSHTGTVSVPWLPCLLSVLLAGAVTAAVCAVARRSH